MSGQFVIQDLDESLIFTVIAAANGYKALIKTKVDPEAEPLELKLNQVKKGLPKDQKMSGVVVDQNGNPVFGAQVSIDGAAQAGRRWHGRVNNVDKLAITNEKGEFFLTSEEAYEQWSLSVSAAGFVNQDTERFDTGNKKHIIKLDPGSTVIGTVKNSKGDPVSNMQIGICQTDRGEGFVGEYIIATDQDGRFEFNSVLSKAKFTIYSKLINEDDLGMFEIESFKSPKSDTMRDLGVFVADPTAIRTVKGRLILTDDTPLPKGMRMLASRENAWDSQNVDIKEDGTFEVKGLAPNEDYSFSVRLKGYRLSNQHNTFQQTRPGQLRIFVNKDFDKFKIHMEPVPSIESIEKTAKSNQSR